MQRLYTLCLHFFSLLVFYYIEDTSPGSNVHQLLHNDIDHRISSRFIYQLLDKRYGYAKKVYESNPTVTQDCGKASDNLTTLSHLVCILILWIVFMSHSSVSNKE